MIDLTVAGIKNDIEDFLKKLWPESMLLLTITGIVNRAAYR